MRMELPGKVTFLTVHFVSGSTSEYPVNPEKNSSWQLFVRHGFNKIKNDYQDTNDIIINRIMFSNFD